MAVHIIPNIVPPEPTDFVEWMEKVAGVEIEVRDRGVGSASRNRYYAFAVNVEVKEGTTLRSAFGNGSTPQEAVADYAAELANERLVVGAARKNRVDLTAPREWKTIWKDAPSPERLSP